MPMLLLDREEAPPLSVDLTDFTSAWTDVPESLRQAAADPDVYYAELAAAFRGRRKVDDLEEDDFEPEDYELPPLTL
jgi:hypothetical protein